MRQRTSENGQILNENETEAQNASNTRADPADITKTHTFGKETNQKQIWD